MALPVYPSNLPFKPITDSFQVPEISRPPRWTEFEDGPALGRRSGLGRRAKMAYRIPFDTAAQVAAFKSFVENDLVDGTARFTMPVYVLAAQAYETRTVQIDKGSVQIAPWGLGYAATFTLIVYNW